MTSRAWLLLLVYFGVLLALVKPLGAYMARVYDEEPTWLGRLLGPVERGLYRLFGVDPKREMNWRQYAVAVLAFSTAGFVFLYALQRLQALLPLNPDGLPAVPALLAFNTAVSFVTNTNWQAYGGETTMSYLSQAAGLATQNFVSAAAGMAVLVALIRGIRGRSLQTIGNFWVDLTRTTLYILLPLAAVLALALVSQGVVQTMHGAAAAAPVAADSAQHLAVGPVASQIAIKQLGTNGGGWYNANSAVPFENPTPVSNFLECLAILLIPAALTYTYGKMVGDRRQGWAILAAMLVLLVPPLVVATVSEQHQGPAVASVTGVAPGPNLEGKEVRYGVPESALWATVTTAASNGSVNSMHDSYTPIGGAVPIWMMMLGEVSFGGTGSGLYGLLAFVLVAVFVSGLMVGRTPEYLGKKIGAYEMKMASIAVLVTGALILIGTAVAVAGPGRAGAFNPGPHGFSEILYGFDSGANNNGSAFTGLGAAQPFYAIAIGLVMWFGRFFVIVPVLAIAGSLAGKQKTPPSAGTLATHTPLFVVVLVGTVLLVGALNFLPALALGPIVEQLTPFVR